jgi:hypothetical protein
MNEHPTPSVMGRVFSVVGISRTPFWLGSCAVTMWDMPPTTIIGAESFTQCMAGTILRRKLRYADRPFLAIRRPLNNYWTDIY